MQTTVATTLLLNLQQPTAPPLEESHAVATVTSTESAEVLVYDQSDALQGQVHIWEDVDGVWFVVLDYSDGYSQITLAPGTAPVIEGTLSAEEVSQRTGALAMEVGFAPQAQRGWGGCLVGVAAARVAIATANPVGGMLASVAVGCGCGELIFGKGKSACGELW
ncbi:hypothetical protein [Enhygromyxa salina]|nr:hypothetical protein [Enhygromyxa salina]